MSDTEATAFRRALEDFEMAVSDFLEDPRTGESKLEDARRRVLKLYDTKREGAQFIRVDLSAEPGADAGATVPMTDSSSPSVQDSAKTAGLLGEDQEKSKARTDAPASGSMTETICALCDGKILSHHPRWIATAERVCLDCIGTLVDDALNRRISGRQSGTTRLQFVMSK